MRAWEDWSEEIVSCVRGVPDELLEHVAEILRKSSLVITAGNGGSASLASHAAQALMKPGYKAGGGHAAFCISDAVPILTAHANDGGWKTALLETARPFLDLYDRYYERPVLWLFSSSGRSENIVELAREARIQTRLLQVVAFTGFEGEPLRSLATVSVHINSSDYEVVEPVHDALFHRVQHHLRRE